MSNTTNIGKQAEEAVAGKLAASGYSIIEHNWRVRRAEIDIVARKKKCMYFVEVKYRKNSNYGSGFDYITAAKLRQMELAAQLWAAHNDWSGDCRLLAAEVNQSGDITIVDCSD